MLVRNNVGTQVALFGGGQRRLGRSLRKAL
jgi:hypothetical protein